MLIGVMVASTTTIVNLAWCPEVLYFVAATAPSSLKVNVQGEGVVMDLDADGCLALSNVRGINRVANSFKLPLANGRIGNRNIEISFTNTVAAAVNLFGFSERANGDMYIQCIRQAVLANSGIVLNKFAVLALPGIAVGDTIDIEYHDGLIQRLHRDELRAIQMGDQNEVATHIIDNLEGQVKRVTVIPILAQTAYVMRYAYPNQVRGEV